MLMIPLQPLVGPDPETDDFVAIPAGRFQMGGLDHDKFVSEVELPRREMEIGKEFRISATPITEKQWSEFAGNPAKKAVSPVLPMVGVSATQAIEFAAWLSSRNPGKRYRLPSEVEWEYACRGGTKTIFPWGNRISPDLANFLYDERGNAVGPRQRTGVKHYPPNAFGIYDMPGNVCEWTASSWTQRPESGDADPSRKVIRGGAWDHLPRTLRASWRDWAPVDARYDNLGFRLIEENAEI